MCVNRDLFIISQAPTRNVHCNISTARQCSMLGLWKYWKLMFVVLSLPNIFCLPQIEGMHTHDSTASRSLSQPQNPHCLWQCKCRVVDAFTKGDEHVRQVYGSYEHQRASCSSPLKELKDHIETGVPRTRKVPDPRIYES